VLTFDSAATIFPFPVAKRMLHFSPWTFDQGLADMLFAFSYGATLLLANMEDMLTDMSAVLNGTRADYATMTPALAGLIRTDVDHPHLKTLVCGGEKLPAQLIPRWRGKINFIDA
jgi:non-ribosomal peptide synthetase component F